MEKDSQIKELKETIEVISFVYRQDSGTQNQKNGRSDQTQRQ
jgi:hypothetical protein